jgi:hypothetical protein
VGVPPTGTPREPIVEVGDTPTPTSEPPELPTATSTVIVPDVGNPPQSLPQTLKILYLKNRDIWLWTPGAQVPLTSSADVYDLRLSPDGELVAYIRRVDDFHAEIWLVAASGGEARSLVGTDAFDAIAEPVRDLNAVAINPYQFEWQPGERRLAFSGYQVYDGPGFTPLDDLQIVDAESFERWTLLEPGSGGEFTYAPDGSQLAIVTPTDISLMDANAGNWRYMLRYEQVLTYSEYRYYAQPVWSPDGDFLRVALPPTDPLDPSLSTELWRLPAHGGAAFMEGQIYPLPFFDTPVVYAPDLTELVYLTEAGPPEVVRRELRLAAPDGSAERVYAEDYLLRFLGWGLDNQHFTYVVGDESLAWLGQVDAPAAVFPIQPTEAIAVHWIDERLYLYTRESEAGFELYLGSLDSGVLFLDLIVGPPPVIVSSTN